MAVKIRLKRMGRSNAAFYRLNAIDSRSPRDGRVIEELGHYDPRNKDQAKQFVAKIDRCRHWLDVGAVPSETVSALLKKNGLDHKNLIFRKHQKAKPVPAPAEPKAEAGAPTTPKAAATPAAAEPSAPPETPAESEKKEEATA